jgi:hypothetical protein
MIENVCKVCLWATCDEKSKGIWNLTNCLGNGTEQLALSIGILALVQSVYDDEAGMVDQVSRASLILGQAMVQ